MASPLQFNRLNSATMMNIYRFTVCVMILAAQSLFFSPAALAQTTPEFVNTGPITGSAYTFTWAENSTSVNKWWLYVGTTQGGRNLHDSGSLAAGTLQQSVSDLPLDGSVLHLRLWYLVSGAAWNSIDMTVSASGTPLDITSHANGDQLLDAFEVVSWNPGADTYWLYAGSTPGARDYFDSGNLGTDVSALVGVLPVDGVSDVYLRLWYRFNGGSWLFLDRQVLASDGSGDQLPVISPDSGTLLTSGNQEFSWQVGSISIDKWWLYVGTSVGGLDVANSGNLNQATSYTVSNIPQNGEALYVRLWFLITGSSRWEFIDTIYDTEEDIIVSALTATHRDGQTFLTWPEIDSDAEYHVYRHNAPITEANLADAEQLTSQWGPIGPDSSKNIHANQFTPTFFVIEDLGTPLADDVGLFVHTTQDGQDGNAYYAVTAVVNGVEIPSVITGQNSLTSPVSETESTPKPVLTLSKNSGKGRIYTQYMDYAKWNPTFNGYAYNYSVALPPNYNPAQSYPLQVVLHSHGDSFPYLDNTEYNYQVIQVFPSDPGLNQSATHSWWYGYAKDHDYRDGSIPTAGTVENLTEQRVLMAIDAMIADAAFNADPQLVHVWGHSMGGSGALALGMRYSDIISGIYGNQPMTDYESSPAFQSEFEKLWGTPTSALLTVNNGPYSQKLQQFNGINVWDWMDHQYQLENEREFTRGYLMTSHGKLDNIIDWDSQGANFVGALTNGNAGFSAKFDGNAGHGWLGFVATVTAMFGLGEDGVLDHPWRYPLDLSFPAITNATGSADVIPDNVSTDEYNLNIEWHTANNVFDESIEDNLTTYGISLRSTSGLNQQAGITPRRTQAFVLIPGESCSYQVERNSDDAILASGSATVSVDGLITIPNVDILTGLGSRLIIDNCN